MQENISEESKEPGLFCMRVRGRNILSESKVTLNVAMEIKWGFQLLHARAAFLKDSFFFYFIFFLFILSEALFYLLF